MYPLSLGSYSKKVFLSKSSHMEYPNYEFSRDKDGKEQLIKDGTYQVMMEWERPYMEACIDALAPHGDVLEIGFGLGYSAEAIQKYDITSHTIIEYHPVVAKKARAWAANKPNVTIIEDTWQNAMDALGTYDAIFFDDYPLESKKIHEELTECKIKSDAYTSSHVQMQHKNISREEIDGFLSHLTHGEMEIADPTFLFRFLTELKQTGAIDSTLYDYAIMKAKKEQLLHDSNCNFDSTPQGFRGEDRLVTFFSRCMNTHMKKGARFSCYLETMTSRFDDPFFFNSVISSPFYTLVEKEIEVSPPKHCAYFSSTKALVVTIEKHG